MKIKENIEAILKDIQLLSPYPEKVKLVTVTKYVNCSVIEEALNSGALLLGENKVQVLREKEEILKEFTVQPKWHFIGNLQRNKVKYIIPFIDMIHSINKLSLAQEVDEKAKRYRRVIDVLIEINIFEEESKSGYQYEEFINDIPELLKLKNISIKGLMTMAPNIDDKNYIQNGFRKLRELKEFLNLKYFNGSLTELSMGMSNDYKIALREGATFIRIGSKIFK